MLKQLFLQSTVHVRLLPEEAPEDEADGEHAEGQDLPPWTLEPTAHGALHCPRPVAGFTCGELDGLREGLLVIAGTWRATGLGAEVWRERQPSHNGQVVLSRS